MSDDKMILVDGLFSYDVRPEAPEYVLGRTAYKVDQFIEFLQNNKQYAVNGFLYVDTLRSKGGKRYCKLDLYDFNKLQGQPQTAPQAPSGRERAREVANSLPHTFMPLEDLGIILFPCSPDNVS